MNHFWNIRNAIEIYKIKPSPNHHSDEQIVERIKAIAKLLNGG
jgi:ribosome maturation protein Sdo1